MLDPYGFDDPSLPVAGGIISTYNTPHAVGRADGMRVPFEPADARFLSLF